MVLNSTHICTKIFKEVWKYETVSEYPQIYLIKSNIFEIYFYNFNKTLALI